MEDLSAVAAASVVAITRRAVAQRRRPFRAEPPALGPGVSSGGQRRAAVVVGVGVGVRRRAGRAVGAEPPAQEQQDARSKL